MNLHMHNQSMSIVTNVCEFDVRPCRCVLDAIHKRVSYKKQELLILYNQPSSLPGFGWNLCWLGGIYVGWVESMLVGWNLCWLGGIYVGWEIFQMCYLESTRIGLNGNDVWNSTCMNKHEVFSNYKR
jgi:hypothetical protein